MSAPKGPRLPPEQHTDAEGTFTVYPGKVCAVCALALTSRNRYGTRRLCLPHGSEMDSARHHPPGWTPSPRPTQTMSTTPKAVPVPFANRSVQHQRLQALLGAFMNYPTREGASQLVIDAMNDYELMARLREVIPG